MPFLRMPEDNTLAETLGNLGSSLGNALNPMNQLRAYDIQQQMFIRRQQLEQLQRENNAKQAAVQRYGHLLPPAALPEIANMIYQGAPADQVGLRAAQLSGRLVDDPSDTGTNQNIQTLQRDFGVQWKEAYPPVAGAQTQANRLKVEAAQAGATSQAQEQGKVNVQTQNAPAIAQAEGLKAGAVTQGQNTAKQMAIDALTKQQVDDPAHDAENRQRAIAIEALGGPKAPEPGFTIPVGPVTNQIFQKEKSGQAGTTAQQTAAGTAAGGGISTNEQKLFPNGAPGSPGNPVGAAAPIAPAPPPPNVSLPSPSAPFAPPTTVMRQTPAGTVTGQSASETTANTETTKARSDQLTQAMDEGATATRMKVKLAQLRDLETVASTSGVVGQVEAAAAKRLADAGIVVGDKASAYKAMDQILNTEIPDLRKASGIQRLAGPEIQAVGKQIGSATLPPDVLNNIIANEEAAADVQIARRGNAQRAIGLGDQPMSFADYTNADNDLNNSLKQRADALRTQYGAIGTEAQQPAPVAQPTAPLGGNTVLDAIHGALGWLTGGSQPSPQAPPPQATPPAQPQYQFDPKTNSIVPVSPP
jgi:hypothetical protein